MAKLNLYIVTFNCAKALISKDHFASHLFDALPKRDDGQAEPGPELPELLVLSLQEIAPLAHAFIGGSYLAPFLREINEAVGMATATRGGDVRYVNAATHNVGTTAIMLFAREDLAWRVSSVLTAEVGVGALEMGHKGAAGLRIGYATGETTSDGAEEQVELTFVAAHLAPMEDGFQDRNKDWQAIVQRLVFTKGESDNNEHQIDNEGEESSLIPRSQNHDSGRPSGMFVPTSHLFFAGDLNYRTSDSKPTPDGRQDFPQPNADSSHRTHYLQLLKKDQLTREIRAQRTLHSLSEAPITFPPTYKYSSQAQEAAGTGQTNIKEWQWAQHRWPSWCDRILYLDIPPWAPELGSIETRAYDALPLLPTSDHRPVALAVSIPLKAIPSPPAISDYHSDIRLCPPFPLDESWRSRRAAAQTKEFVIGILAYLSLTWEGNGLFLVTGIGAIGGWLALRSVLYGV